MRRGVARLAEHAHHHAAAVVRPDGAVGRQRIGAVALVAVDGRGGEGGRTFRMLQQPGEILHAERRQAVLVREGVALVLTLDQRLMQVPAARHHVGQRRPAHEAGEIAVAARDLLHRRAEQDHGVGGFKAHERAEGEFALAGAELDLYRAQRQAERGNAAPQDRHRRIEHVEARFGEVLVALIEQAQLRRLRRPGGVLRLKPRVLQLEQMEFHFQPGAEVEAGRGQRVERLAATRAGGEWHRLAVAEVDIAKHPAGLVGPRQHAERRGVGDHDEIACALHLFHGKAAAGGEHRIDGAVRGILGEQRRRHGDAAAQCAHHFGGEQCLAAQYAVLVGEREAHQLQAVLLDCPLDGARGALLLGRPQAVAGDEVAQFGGLTGRHGLIPRALARRRAPHAHSPSSWPGVCWLRSSANSPASRRWGRCRRWPPGR